MYKGQWLHIPPLRESALSPTDPTLTIMSRLVISGAGGGAPNRLEINDFIKHDKYFSLYVQALQLMYTERQQSDAQSFFQVGGIHGLPYTPWEGATVEPPVNAENQWAGYCFHSSVLFPTWHRPYMALFEQILWTRAQEVAATYTVDQANWKAAATTIRQPYWDWAKDSVPPPEVISLLQVTITGPDGKSKLVDNPLYQYRFHPIDPSFPTPFNNWPTTLRRPKTQSPTEGDNVAELVAVLKNAQSNIRSNTFNMLTRVNTWPAFSNSTAGDGGSTSNSLEAIHNSIHNLVGGIGHMGDTGTAGFDPIFYLHHTNVDRMLSLWAALHPGVWVTEEVCEEGTFTTPADLPVDDNTHLTPFYNSQETFWASAGIADTAKLGYTYPEFNGLDMANPAAVQKAIAAIVVGLYGDAVLGLLPAKASTIAGTAAGQLWDWTARVKVKKFEIGTSFSILFFLGSVPENPKEYLVSPNLVGAHHEFVNSSSERCANCKVQEDVVDEGFVHLDGGILDLGNLFTLDPDKVEPYLKKELHWRAVGLDSSPVEIPSLEVTIFATPLSYPHGSLFPIGGKARRHNTITHGRTGGSHDA